MTRRRGGRLGALLAVGLMLGACGGGGEGSGGGEDSGEGGAASSVAVATHPVGSSYHAVGTALASLISTHTDIRAAVQPYSGPNAWMPALQSGDVAFGLASAVDVIWAYEGGPGYEAAVPEERLVSNGAPNPVIAMVVREDSDIQTLADVAGKRVATGYGGNAFAGEIQTAQLASVGLTWEDVTGVPVPDTNLAIEALRNGQVDVAFGLTPTSPTVVDLDSSNGVRVLPFGDLQPDDLVDGAAPDEFQEILDEYIPGTRLTVLPGGTGVVDEDTVGIAFNIQMVTSESTTNATVSTVLEAVWNNYEEMHSSHPTGRWTPETMVPVEFSVPYHEGAVEFFESVDAWTDEHQARQDELLGDA